MLKYIVENGNFSNKDIIKLLKDQEFFERIYSIPPEKCFIINLFNVDNVLLCVIYQLIFNVFMHVTRISHYMTLCIVFGIIRGFP